MTLEKSAKISLRSLPTCCQYLICYCSIVWPLFDFKIFHYLHLSSSIFWPSTSFYDLSKFTLSSVFHSPFILLSLSAYFCILYSISVLLCSISIIIFPPSVHYSLPSLPDLDNSTFHSLWLCKSYFTFSRRPHSLYYSEPCSIKFFFDLYLLPQLVIVVYLCKNTTHLCLLCLSKLRTPLFLGKGITHKLKPSPSISLQYPCPLFLFHALHITPLHHSILCSSILLGTLSTAYLHS